MNYEFPTDCLRATAKDWMAEAEDIRRAVKLMEEKAAVIYDRAIALELLADKLDRAAQGGAA